MTTPPPADNNPAGDDAPTDQDQEVRKAASGGAKTFVVTIAAKALTLVFRGLLTNLYGAAAYGLFAFALVIVNMLGLLSTLGLDRAMLRHPRLSEKVHPSQPCQAIAVRPIRLPSIGEIGHVE